MLSDMRNEVKEKNAYTTAKRFSSFVRNLNLSRVK
jgi:hypothetical protein